ncbi:MAG: Obg family GTPase CgtA, partial [Clostridia bacterium]|nr:Obg family GTPase CgtA [Clostridia bacterium]
VYEGAKELEEAAAAHGWEVVYISAAKKENTRGLVTKIARMLEDLPPVLTYEPEIVEDPERSSASPDDVTVSRDGDVFTVEGEWARLLVGRVNFDDRESLMYFENSLNKAGVIDKLREAGCAEGDTVSMYGLEFDFVE